MLYYKIKIKYKLTKKGGAKLMDFLEMLKDFSETNDKIIGIKIEIKAKGEIFELNVDCNKILYFDIMQDILIGKSPVDNIIMFIFTGKSKSERTKMLL